MIRISLITVAVLLNFLAVAQGEIEAPATRKLMNAASRASKAARGSVVTSTPPGGYPGLAAAGAPGAHLEAKAGQPAVVSESYEQYTYDQDQQKAKIHSLEDKDAEEGEEITELKATNVKLWIGIIFLLVGNCGMIYYIYSKKEGNPSGLSHIVASSRLNIPGRK
ncbi:hypothetical protein CYMTET_43623 [Cymbomonas tetramitiformis]|uniref:Uncharacterized protein n=1 Tax=Cymbomonas tetramitiformis TaxID=36881 RepID=A0AAE0C3Q2_9CHLO|nr:hypothetical protein CYMTET_43623 [Cymbomonas tetramitiformis]